MTRRVSWAIRKPAWRTGISILEKHPPVQVKDFPDQAAAKQFQDELKDRFGPELESCITEPPAPRAKTRKNRLDDGGWPRTPRGGPRLKP